VYARAECDTCRPQVLHPKGLGTRQLLALQRDALNPQNGINKRNPATVRVGPDRVAIQYTTVIRAKQETKVLYMDEILGVDISHVDPNAQKEGVLDGLVHKKNMQWIVSIYVLTRPSAPTSETGTSTLEVYQLSSFKGENDEVLDDERHREAAHECHDEVLRVSQRCAPLNREVLQRAGFKRRKLLVIVNPMSGHKMGKVIWEKVMGSPFVRAAGSCALSVLCFGVAGALGALQACWWVLCKGSVGALRSCALCVLCKGTRHFSAHSVPCTAHAPVAPAGAYPGSRARVRCP
jgi:hypothetical protein